MGAAAFGLLTTDHLELGIITNNHAAFLDFYLERTGALVCIVATKLTEVQL